MSLHATPYTIVMMMTAQPIWLNLPHDERNSFTECVIGPILGQYADRISVRFFDAEAFNARSSDFTIFTTTDLKAYYYLMEALRDTPLFAAPYFIINEIVIGLENGHQSYEANMQST